MLTSDRLPSRPAGKIASELPPAPSRIQEIGARLAQLKRQFNEVDGANFVISRMPESVLKTQDYSHRSYLDAASTEIEREMEILERSLSVEIPESTIDALIMTACCSYRLDIIKAAVSEGGDAQDDTDRLIVEDTLNRVIPALEKLAGVTCAALGLDAYFTPQKSPEELVADVAALKQANPSSLMGAEPAGEEADASC
jgi:hypothetical protein